VKEDVTNSESRLEIARLRKSLAELSVINDLARALSVSFDLDNIMKTVIKRTNIVMRASQSTITMLDSNEFTGNGTLVREIEHSNDPHFHLHKSLIGLMLNKKKPFVFNNPTRDEMIDGVPLQPGVKNFVCAPLVVGDTLIGVLTAYNCREQHGFNDDDKRLLAIIGAQSAQVIERARLLADELAAAQYREEIRMASMIQAQLLPSHPPAITGYSVYGLSVPARQVGGDYFDFIEIGDGQWGLALGDVSGKGVPASLLMANLQATLRGQALQGRDCTSCVTWCNRLLFHSTAPEKFATLFYCVLDSHAHTLRYCNAGHEPPLIFGIDHAPRSLGVGGIPTGLLDEFAYQGAEATIAAGDVLVIYSDGVTDMESATGEAFGLARLKELVVSHRDAGAELIAQRLVAAVRAHAGATEPFDDLTVVVVCREALART
jgi:sigma-B regulation protein RsbU (phosphoserine phosphatase)